MTMWGGRFRESPSERFRALNDSFAYDVELLDADVQGSIAWARELGLSGVLPAEDAEAMEKGLAAIAVDYAAPADEPPPHPAFGHLLPRSGGGEGTRDEVSREGPRPAQRGEGGRRPGEGRSALPEDVHSFVEDSLRQALGALAGKLHTGRSRNDQVATDLKLWLKDACAGAIANVTNLAAALAQRAVAEAATPMPGYTHSKQAEPVTFGHWCLAYVEMLKRDRSRLEDALRRGDECPLGSGALAGTPLPIDRDRLARSLGFARATANSMDSVSDRDFAAEYLFAASMLLSHLSRFAEDLIFFTSDEVAYAELPDSLASGSSRMPQKKNPDLLELTRGHAARSIGELTGFLALLKGLPLAYDKDLQLDKEPLFRTRALLALLLPLLADLVEKLQLDRERMRSAAASPLLLATDAADALAAQGIPFREAHEIVSREGRVSTATVEDVLNRKSAIGGTSPARVAEAAKAALEALR